MPDKQNENKFMAMLERKGIIRKADEAESPDQPSPGQKRARQETDLRSAFAVPDPNPQNVTPAPRQPVPGMMAPTRPAEKPPTAPRPEQRPVERVVPLQRSPVVATNPNLTEERTDPKPMPEGTMRIDFEKSAPYTTRPPSGYTPGDATEYPPRPAPAYPSSQAPAYPARPAPAYSSNQVPRNTSADNNRGETMERNPLIPSVESTSYYNPAPQPRISPAEPTTERYMDITELYATLSLSPDRTDTIYLVEEYIKTLPVSLPEDQKREIVGKIVTASGFDYDLLMGDGVMRVKTLKEYAEKFARFTEDYVSERNAELEELEQQTLRVRRLVESRRELHKKQFFTIEAEAQRLKEILMFISG